MPGKCGIGVAAGILLTNVIVEGSMMTLVVPGWTDWWFDFNFGGYAVALIGLRLDADERPAPHD